MLDFLRRPTAIVVLGISLIAGCRQPQSVQPSATNAPVYDRVVESKQLRVGYLVLPPYLAKSTATQQLSGIFFDVVEELGRRLQLKIVWVEEVGLATLSVGFDSNRYDMIAFPLWRSASRAKSVSFSEPLFYSTVGAYVRASDSRFDRGLEALNNELITIATIDGELAADIARSDYPRAKLAALPAMADYSQLLMEVSTSKADATFFNKVFANRFIAKNPKLLKDVSGSKPVRVFAECFVLPLKDETFRTMINATVLEMRDNGDIERAFLNNGEDPAEYAMPARPYRDSAGSR